MNTNSRKAYYTTCRIINNTINGETKYGTGFFMNFTLNNGKVIRTILTCKHVIKNYKKITVETCLDNGGGQPVDKTKFPFSYGIGINDYFVIKHPNENIDLAALVFSYDNRIFVKGPFQPFFLSLDESLYVDGKLQDISFIQDVYMIGYPETIYDSVNNKPVVRKGVTASPIQIDFQDEPKFLIDIKTCHGSSGSPVFIMDESVHFEGNAIVQGDRFILLGIFTSGWDEITEGQKITEGSCDGEKFNIKVKIPNDLGFVLKTKVFKDLKPLLESFVKYNIEN